MRDRWYLVLLSRRWTAWMMNISDSMVFFHWSAAMVHVLPFASIECYLSWHFWLQENHQKDLCSFPLYRQWSHDVQKMKVRSWLLPTIKQKCTIASMVNVNLVPFIIESAELNWVRVFYSLMWTPCDILQLKLTRQVLSFENFMRKSWWKGPAQMV